MARLPSERYLIQQIGGQVVLYEDFTEREIVRFDPTDANAAARAQHTIHLSELSEEDKCFAHFWSGYFYAHATSAWSKPNNTVDPVGLMTANLIGLGNVTKVERLVDPRIVDGGTVPRVDTSHLHEHDQTRAEDKTYESRLH